jgi:hypothetical protein
MARNSLTHIPGFCVKFFFQPIYTDNFWKGAIQESFQQSLVEIGEDFF